MDVSDCSEDLELAGSPMAPCSCASTCSSEHRRCALRRVASRMRFVPPRSTSAACWGSSFLNSSKCKPDVSFRCGKTSDASSCSSLPSSRALPPQVCSRFACGLCRRRSASPACSLKSPAGEIQNYSWRVASHATSFSCSTALRISPPKEARSTSSLRKSMNCRNTVAAC